MPRIDQGMTTRAYNRARQHVKHVCSLGHDVTLIKQSNKDEMGTGRSEITIELKAHPVRYSPFDRDVIEKISWAENVEILCYISKKEIVEKGYDTRKLKTKFNKMRHGSKTYDIRYIENYWSFNSDFLYIVVGGKS